MNSFLNLFPLLAVSWLLIIALIVFLIRLFRIKFSYYWLLSTFGVLVAWVLVLLSRSGLPYIQDISSIFPDAEVFGLPSLLVDGISWSYALVLMTLSLVVYLTFVIDSSQMDWLSLGGGLVLTAFSLVAIQSRDATTIRASWAAIDIAEFLLLFLRIRDRKHIDHLIRAFGLRIIGNVLFLWGTSNTNILLLSAGIRLVVIPAGFFKQEELSLPRCMINFLTFISPLSCFIVFARVALASDGFDINPLILIVLLGFGLLASIAWFNARDGFEGRGYWVLAISSFVILAAMRGLLIASISLGIAIILSGRIFLFDEKIIRKPIFLYIGMLAITSIPFMPSWDGASLYTSSLRISFLAFILIQSILVSGYIKHINIQRTQVATAERWIMLIHPLRLIILVCVYWLLAFLFWRDGVVLRNSLPWLLPKNSIDYFIGFIIIAVSIAMYILWQKRNRLPNWIKFSGNSSSLTGWLYKAGFSFFRLGDSVINGLSSIIEGESGILLTLLLLVLLITFFIQGA